MSKVRVGMVKTKNRKSVIHTGMHQVLEQATEKGRTMVRLTQSLFEYLWNNHSEIIALVQFGHTELITDEIWNSYIDWCKTDEGRQYLLGGSKYDENWKG